MADEFQFGRSGTARQQVDDEVTVAQVGRAVANMFDGHYDHQSGGGGTGGRYEFTSLAELDTIIAELKTMTDGIAQDGAKLYGAVSLIRPPADDVMSVLQAQAAVDSLLAAADHNQRMLAAAEAEIAKLKAARQAYAQVEDTNTQSFRMRG